jgi:ribosomal protein S18 acetylase RimI-like enzyme
MTLVVVTIRPAQPDDAPEVAAVWQAAWHDGHRGHVPDALVEARDGAYFAQRSRDLLDHVTVAVDGERVLGVLITSGDELQQLMVSDAARGRGVGGLLLAEAERLVGADGFSRIWLAVVPGNTTARRFYESHGWVDRGEEVYDAVTLQATTVAMPVRRYVKDLTGRPPR